MNIPGIFVREFWDISWLIWAFVLGSLIGLVIRLASNGGGTFMAPTKSFPELAAFTKDDQQRFLREASKKAFSALSFVPVLVVLAFLWVGFALAATVQKVTALPVWAVCVLPPLFGGLGFWLGGRLEAHRVRPFLKKLIDGQNGKSVA
jgi:ABC-type amino acid transport system permease subunit